jgi:hypothetical protein
MHGRPLIEALTEASYNQRLLPHAPEALKQERQIYTGFQMYEARQAL